MSARISLALVALLVVACGADSAEESTTTESTTTTIAIVPIELTASDAPLEPGSYTRSGFRPAVSFSIEADGWVVGTLHDGFFDIQQDPGSPDVIAVQFARVLGVVGSGGSMTTPANAEDALESIKANPGLVVLGDSPSQLGGLDGFTVEVENAGTTTTSVMQVALGTLGFDPNRRLWISLFDTADGLVAVLVGGSVTGWELALQMAEPVLESIVINGG